MTAAGPFPLTWMAAVTEHYLRAGLAAGELAADQDAGALLRWAEAIARRAGPEDVYRHKEGRTTLRFGRDGRSYFLKLHRGVGWAEIIKNLLQARLPVLAATNEYRAISILRRSGVDTLSVAAYARRGHNPAAITSMIVTDDLVGTVSLEHYCADWASKAPPPSVRMRLVRKLADSARRMHAAGINHRDFYLCHFHLDPDSVSAPELRCYLIDLHRAQLRRQTPRRWLVKDLAGLYFSAMDCGLGRRDLLRFMRHYSATGLAGAMGEQAGLWAEVERVALRLYRKAHNRMPPPIAGTVTAGKELVRGHQWAARLRQLPNYPPADAVAWMESQTRLLKADTWSRVGLLQLRGECCFAKLYVAKTAWQRLGFRLGYGRAVHSFDAAVKLAAAGLPVPAPRACLRLPAGMLLLTEGFAAGRDLRALWLEQPGNDLALQLLPRSAQLLAALHRAGFAHGDCKWSNLLWSGEQFYLVDLEAVRKPGGGGGFHPGQARDLARFTVDAEELGLKPELFRLFLDTYLASAGYPRDLVLQRIRPLVATIRARHLKKHAVACAPLV